MPGLNGLFWIFLVFVMVYPAIQKRILESSRLRLLRRLEKRRNSRAIALVHRQETMTFLGFPLMRYITIEDSEEILRAIRMTPPDMPLNIVLHTPGGLVLATEQIANALLRHKAEVSVFIPHYAMSGGTLIALAADRICMDENAVLGPLDPILGEYPAASLLRVAQQKERADMDDKTLIMADLAGMAMRQIKVSVQEVLRKHLDEKKAVEVAALLTEGNFTHDYPIRLEQLRGWGLEVSTEMPEEVYQLMNLFPQASTNRPTVQYVPFPYPPVKKPAAPQKFRGK
ncbi:ATP-dependent Clp protease proteolytic subunit [bacterium]|nr:ATP-dependent Clp protease proteolytic subunit [candidate division CSSED10-310 bacterium]